MRTQRASLDDTSITSGTLEQHSNSLHKILFFATSNQRLILSPGRWHRMESIQLLADTLRPPGLSIGQTIHRLCDFNEHSRHLNWLPRRARSSRVCKHSRLSHGVHDCFTRSVTSLSGAQKFETRLATNPINQMRGLRLIYLKLS